MNREVILPSPSWIRKPEELTRDSVPIGTNKLGRKLVCIQYPGIVNNLSKALTTLGGLEDINTVSFFYLKKKSKNTNCIIFVCLKYDLLWSEVYQYTIHFLLYSTKH